MVVDVGLLEKLGIGVGFSRGSIHQVNMQIGAEKDSSLGECKPSWSRASKTRPLSECSWSSLVSSISYSTVSTEYSNKLNVVGYQTCEKGTM